MGLRDIAPIIENDNREAAMADTWGHLAPVKNRTYKGRVVFAIGCYDSGDLNPTPLVVEFKGLPDSPWLYGAINTFLQDMPEEFKAGEVHEWKGTFRNYTWEGESTLVYSAANP